MEFHQRVWLQIICVYGMKMKENEWKWRNKKKKNSNIQLQVMPLIGGLSHTIERFLTSRIKCTHEEINNTTWLSLTVTSCRCHCHVFFPIHQSEEQFTCDTQTQTCILTWTLNAYSNTNHFNPKRNMRQQWKCILIICNKDVAQEYQTIRYFIRPTFVFVVMTLR